MAVLKPFRALRPHTEVVARVASVPYDVVNRSEAAQLAQGNPLSFLHISRPEIDLPSNINPYSEDVYQKARTSLEALKIEAPLVLEPQPCLYLYRLRAGSQEQIGIAGTFSVEEYDRELIKKHERTRKDKEDDRTRHLLAIGAQTGSVFLAFRGTSQFKQLSEAAVRESPLYDFKAPDGVTHTVWKLEDTAPWVGALAQIPHLYIADGHHRAASASRAHAELKGKPGTHDHMLAVAFPAEQLKILPYHRTVKDLGSLTAETLLEKLRAHFDLRKDSDPNPARGEFAMYLKKSWYNLRPRTPLTATADSIAQSLDVSVLQRELLAPILGIGDPRTDTRIDFVGGIRGTAELERLVNEGRAAVAFSVHPTSLEDLMRVSDSGEIMPPKSTWFEPKLRDGILSHVII